MDGKRPPAAPRRAGLSGVRRRPTRRTSQAAHRTRLRLHSVSRLQRTVHTHSTIRVFECTCSTLAASIERWLPPRRRLHLENERSDSCASASPACSSSVARVPLLPLDSHRLSGRRAGGLTGELAAQVPCCRNLIPLVTSYVTSLTLTSPFSLSFSALC